jgi:hypothetical protein
MAAGGYYGSALKPAINFNRANGPRFPIQQRTQELVPGFFVFLDESQLHPVRRHTLKKIFQKDLNKI